jgi:hypothetical protein
MDSALVAHRSSLRSGRPPARSWLILVVAVASAGCSRDGNKVILTPPFNDGTKIGEVSAQWENTGEERAFADGRKLDMPEVRFQYRVNVRNRLQDKVFVRLGGFRLVNEAGSEMGKSAARIECVLSVGDTPGLLRGDVWVPARGVRDVSGFGVTHFAVPLSERGRALYREWALQGRKSDAAAVDAEIGAYAAAPACAAS